MVDTTRRSFLTGITGLFASLMVPSVSGATTKKAPTETEKLMNIYMPLCEKLEGDMPFAYKDKDHPTIGCGVHFKNFKEELDGKTVFRITPKKNCSLTLNTKCKNGALILNKQALEKIVKADWTKPETRVSFPNVGKVEKIKLKDYSGECPTSKTQTWNLPLYWAPKETRDKANHCATEFCIKKAKEIHKDLFQLPPSVRLVIVDLIYNLGDSGYGSSDCFPNFKTAVRARNFENMKKECTVVNNSRRNTTRQCLIESAKLANEGKTEEQIKQALRKKFPNCESSLWFEIDKCTKENCTWKKHQIAQNRKSHRTQRT